MAKTPNHRNSPRPNCERVTCLWAPPFLNPHPILSTSSPPPRHLVASLDSQSHLSQPGVKGQASSSASTLPHSFSTDKISLQWAWQATKRRPRRSNEYDTQGKAAGSRREQWVTEPTPHTYSHTPVTRHSHWANACTPVPPP